MGASVRRQRGHRALDLLHVRQPQQGVYRAGSEELRRPRRPGAPHRPRRRVNRELQHRRATDSASDSHNASPKPTAGHLSITGFGHDGPEGGRAGYDQIAQGEAGLMSLTGPERGRPARSWRADRGPASGMYGEYGVAAALNERTATGRGVSFGLAARCSGRRSRLPGHDGTPSPAKSPSAQGNAPPVDRPYGLFRVETAPYRSPSAAMACGDASAMRSLSRTVRPPRSPRTPTESRLGH